MLKFYFDINMDYGNLKNGKRRLQYSLLGLLNVARLVPVFVRWCPPSKAGKEITMVS